MSVRSLFAAILLAVGAAVHVTVLSGDRAAVLAAEPNLRLEHISAEHLADMYARIAKGVPLSAESEIALPVRDVFAEDTGAIMVEISDRVGPFAPASTVFRADALTHAQLSAYDAVSLLAKHSIPVKRAALPEATANGELQQLADAATNRDSQFVQLKHLESLKAQFGLRSAEYVQHAKAINKQLVELSKVKPVIVVEYNGHELDDQMMASRQLSFVSAASNSTGPSVEQIADYQITLWTAVGLFSSFFVVAYLVGAMNIEPDSLLYAKFQSTRAQNKND